MKSHILAARFAAYPTLQILMILALLGGGWLTFVPGLILFGALVVFDGIGREYRNPHEAPHPVFYEALLWLVVLLSTLLWLTMIAVTASDGTFFSSVASMLRGDDGGAYGTIATIGAIASTGFILGTATPFSHELFHRQAKLPWYTAQVALAQFFYAPLAIEHVQGHHRNVGLDGDLTTAPRGLSFWRYLPRTIVGTYKGAALLEAKRLSRQSKGPFNWRNRFLHGIGLQLMLLAGLAYAGGLGAIFAAVAAGFIAIMAIEAVQYVSHYGIMRAPGRPIENRHAWNGVRLLSTSLMINLHHHSEHHRSASRPYWKLGVPEDAPVYPAGIGCMAFAAFYPRLFFRLTEPLLQDWDRRLASAEELELLRTRYSSRSVSAVGKTDHSTAAMSGS